MNNPMIHPRQGLYDPANERDACGVGFVAHIKGRKSHTIIEQGRNPLRSSVAPVRRPSVNAIAAGPSQGAHPREARRCRERQCGSPSARPYPKIDLQAISYYSAPKPKKKLNSIDEVDPELLRTFEKLGVPMNERAALIRKRFGTKHQTMGTDV